MDNSTPAKSQAVAKCSSIHFQGRVKGGLVFPQKESLERHFGQFGVVVDLTLTPNQPSGDATFQTKNQAQQALSCPEHVVDGCSLVLIPRKKNGTSNW